MNEGMKACINTRNECMLNECRSEGHRHRPGAHIVTRDITNEGRKHILIN